MPTDNLHEKYPLVKTYSTKDFMPEVFLIDWNSWPVFREVLSYSAYYQTQTYFWTPAVDTHYLKFL